MPKVRPRALYSFWLSVSTLVLCMLPFSLQAKNISSIVLRQDALHNGYTVRHNSGTFFVGIQPRAITGIDSTRVELRRAKEPGRYPSGHQKRLIGDVYKYELGKAKHFKLKQPLWVTLSYPQEYQNQEKVIKIWDRADKQWKALSTSDHKDKLQVTTALHNKHATVAVFLKSADTFIGGGNALNGKASFFWWDGPGVACNDFPFGSIIRVTNTTNGKSVDAKVISTGPFVAGRVVDLSDDDFAKIANLSTGVINVHVERVK